MEAHDMLKQAINDVDGLQFKTEYLATFYMELTHLMRTEKVVTSERIGNLALEVQRQLNSVFQKNS
ncbi:hypothetical protein Pryu01_03087 [Paraliobacillus ryukyuensis]|uniref:Uncharacterized protein n=2 Tax=Paraliobacillus ryukyuensis TaxID=200904 RepID=A0A366DMK6_9BACI|nr:hypothetical protein DES48_1191 [Paraliobacillus ryukyuensis]